MQPLILYYCSHPLTNSRIETLVQMDKDVCWPWPRLHSDGYGLGYPDGLGKPTLMHRWFYELFVGPIPDDCEIDHICHKADECPGGKTDPHRRCFTLKHLAAVTKLENNSRTR